MVGSGRVAVQPMLHEPTANTAITIECLMAPPTTQPQQRRSLRQTASTQRGQCMRNILMVTFLGSMPPHQIPKKMRAFFLLSG